MPPVVLVLLAGAAILHVLWNVLVKTSGDPLHVSARAVASGAVIATPFAGAAWWLGGRPDLPSEAIVLAGASALVELAYFVFLSAAYRRGELSLVYPVARGSAPLVAVLIGLLVLGERLGPTAAAGIGLLLTGIWIVWWPRGVSLGIARAGGAEPKELTDPSQRLAALGFALLTGLTIAIYSAIDRLGVQVAPPWLYGWLLWTLTAIALQAWIRVPLAGDVLGGDAARTADHGTILGRPLVVGVAMLGAWLLVLVALSLAPLAIVAPLRESGIVVATAWGVLGLGERRGAALRLVGGVAIVGGVILVSVPR